MSLASARSFPKGHNFQRRKTVCYSQVFVLEASSNLKDRLHDFWQAHPCGSKFSDAEPGTRLFFERIEEHRYSKEWHIPEAADFASSQGQKVLEIGCGMGTDGAQFARAGAHYTGVDLTEAAVELSRKRFELFNLPGDFRLADAEQLDFPDETFDIVYSHGVLQHTPDTARAVREAHRVLRPGGRAIVMLYHRDSYNYRVGVRILRRPGTRLLRHESGLRLIHYLTGEPLSSLREHARLLEERANKRDSQDEFGNQDVDGASGLPIRVYSRSNARELFKDFADIQLRVFFLNTPWLPLVGQLLPRVIESRLASRWGWHLWIYARK